MPLSEHEQRQLEQIEQALYADHPRLARKMRARDPKVHFRRRVIQSAIGFIIGAGGVAAGFVLKFPWLEAAGLTVMLASSVWAVASYRRMTAIVMDSRRSRSRSRGRGRKTRGGPKATPGVSLMERLEERWRRRQEGRR